MEESIFVHVPISVFQRHLFLSAESKAIWEIPLPHLGSLKIAPSEKWGIHLNMDVRSSALPELLGIQWYTVLDGDSFVGVNLLMTSTLMKTTYTNRKQKLGIFQLFSYFTTDPGGS